MRSFSIECPDTYELIRVLRLATLWGVIREARRGYGVINDVVKELSSEASVIYIKLRGEGIECRALINVNESKAFISCLRGSEEVCGSDALELINELFSESYIMFIRGK